MIRIWLGPDDLARTRLLPAPLPLHEVFATVAARATRPGRELRDLAHAGAYPDFLAPLPDGPAPEPLDASLSRLADTGRSRIRRELVAFTGGALNAWHHSLAAGERAAFHRLIDAVRREHDRHTAPACSDASADVQRDVRAKARSLALSGVEGLFGTIHPRVRWHNPVLVVDADHDVDLRPNGAGVTFVPSVAAVRPWVGTDPAALFIAYPVASPQPGSAAPGGPAGEDSLAALLGRSRAAVLRAAADAPGTTTDLARRAGISTPSASQHLAVLRAAGLLTTSRRGNAAHHSVTSLAYALLTGGVSG
ncbi:ArsR/SmtB family transcription factor [Catenuloplanes atrovinosus]|uniref:DNA-binding transcriptional ArsR family regulator n=1 Tax=Catenuloplanes atrovinosus TaxID=137266 RepID=A0AAE3YST9_9ACTN|nr:helix-turn-helix domain-containing protein [Catenuloplanes atrovinosus]MDR7277952.1 DNA-binding transcriptional ArsR family regulator [Catenuloplanes atrovinosus]